VFFIGLCSNFENAGKGTYIFETKNIFKKIFYGAIFDEEQPKIISMQKPSRIKLFFINMVFWTWCLPQTLTGLAIYLYIKGSGRLREKSRFKNVCLVKSDNLLLIGGISLGKFIIVSDRIFEKNIILHEYGHTIQGYMLGPIYLLVIGIPSLFLSIISRFSPTVSNNYFRYFPERWADKLGGNSKVRF